jgi:hypothetical protein
MLTRLAFEQDIVDARKVQQPAQQQASRSRANNHNLGPHDSLPHKPDDTRITSIHQKGQHRQMLP